MTVLAIPNVSEGRDVGFVDEAVRLVERHGSHVLDVHRDPVHNRSVLTIAGDDAALVASTTALAELCSSLDMTRHRGAHPRLGGLDVCPFVPHGTSMERASAVALAAAEEIHAVTALPIYLYGEVARTPDVTLPAIRKGGLDELARRANEGFIPDLGDPSIDLRRGVVCVGARDVSIAFNVWLRCDMDVARAIASTIRASDGGLPGVRTLGLEIHTGVSQISMNLIDPLTTGIDAAFDAVDAEARQRGAIVAHTEIVGLVPERFLPDASAKTARLLTEPSRSLESVLLQV